MLKTIKNISLFLFIILLFSACEEDFDIVTDYKDQTVVYAFLNHQDPWNGPLEENLDTNWIVVNKAFLGEANVYDMASVADSVNYFHCLTFYVCYGNWSVLNVKYVCFDFSV